MKRFLYLVAALLLLAAAPSNAQFNGCSAGFCPGSIGGVGPSSPAGFSQFFINYASAYASGTTYPNTTTSRTTTNGIATAPDAAGNYLQFADNVPRITSGLGLWSEEARTNSVRNNTMVGSASSAPTNWVNGGGSGISFSFGATFTAQNVTWLPVSFTGTATASTTISLGYEASTQIAASYGQTWTNSLLAYAIGSVPSPSIDTSGRNSGGGQVEDAVSGFAPTATPTRYQASNTFAVSTTAFALPRLYFGIVNGSSYGGTIYIAAPQIENNTLINASVAPGAQTITNNGTSTCVSGTYAVVGGTGTAATLTGVASGGVITSLTTLTGGSYTVFPPSPSALTGTGCSVSPTVTLTPTNNAAQGFATTPILTSGSAGARGAELNSVTTPPTFTSSHSVFFRASPLVPLAGTSNQFIGQAYVTNDSFRSGFYRNSGGSIAVIGTNSSAYWNVLIPGGTVAPLTTLKVAGSFAPSAQSAAMNGGTLATNATGTPPVPTAIAIGSSSVGNQFNGVIGAVGINPTTALTGAQLQAATAP